MHAPGRINSAWLAFLGSVVLLAVLIAMLAVKPQQDVAKTPLLVYCAAGIKTPVEAAAAEYEAESGIPIQLQFGASQTLLAGIETTRRGDLYIPADDSYQDLAQKKELIAERVPLAKMNLILGVKKGNPKNIKSIPDLLKPNVKLSQANPDSTAVGKIAREALQKSGQWGAIKEGTTVFKGTVNDVAADIMLGAVDAGFIWDAMLKQFPDIEEVKVPEFEGCVAKISISVLKSCTNPTAALRFARYLGAKDKGLKEFEGHGYVSAEGDTWVKTPELRLLVGAMLRPAIEETITAFEAREGCRVTRVYNGCGILVAQMRAGQRPDAYFACDGSFMKQVNDLFLDSSDVSTNQLVILVKKGNPHNIHALKDLGQESLKVGVGHEKQCALGALTKTTLEVARIYNSVAKNVTVQSPTGDMLVNQLRTGSLDAVIAYRSNMTPGKDELEAVSINIPCATAVQPFAVGKESEFKLLAARLLDAIKSAESKQRFEINGFKWSGDEKKGEKEAAK